MDGQRYYKFEIAGRIPSKKNGQRIVKHGNKYSIRPSKGHDKWFDSAMIIMGRMGVPQERYRCSRVQMKFYFPDLRVADLYNKAESIADLMTKYGLTRDDNWKDSGVVTLIPYYCPEKPRCEVTLEILEEK